MIQINRIKMAHVTVVNGGRWRTLDANLTGVRRYVVLALLTSTLTACASLPKAVSAEQEKIQQIRSVALVDVKTIPMQVRAGTGTSLLIAAMPGVGVLGAAIAGGVQGAITGGDVLETGAAYAKLSKSRGFNLPSQLTKQIKGDLEARGYEVELIEPSALPKRSDNTIDYAHVRTGADAILHVTYSSVGYRSPAFRTDWLPMFGLTAQLIGKSTGETLYAKTIVAGEGAPTGSSERMDVVKMTTFSSSADLLRNIDKSMAEMTNAQASIAQTLIRFLDTRKTSNDIAPHVMAASVPAYTGTPQGQRPDFPQHIDIADVESLPNASPAMKERYRVFLQRPAPRAFAISQSGKDWRQTWGRTTNPNLPMEVGQRAVRLCEEAAKEPCFLYAVDDHVVYQGSPSR